MVSKFQEPCDNVTLFVPHPDVTSLSWKNQYFIDFILPYSLARYSNVSVLTFSFQSLSDISDTPSLHYPIDIVPYCYFY